MGWLKKATQAVAKAASSVVEQAPKAAGVVMDNAVPGGAGLSAFNKTNVNTSITDNSVALDYKDQRVAASEGSIVAGAGATLSSASDPGAWNFGGQVASAALAASAPAAAGTLGDATQSGAAPVAGTVAAAAGIRWWLIAAGVGALALVFFIPRRK